jgi:hypothetical protein
METGWGTAKGIIAGLILGWSWLMMVGCDWLWIDYVGLIVSTNYIYIYTVYIYIDLSLIILHIESVGFRCRPVCQGTTSPNLQAFTLVVPRDSSGRYVKTFALGWWFQIYSLSIPGIIAIYSHPKTIEKQHSARMVINYMLCSWCYNAMRVSKFHHSPKMGWVILNDQVGTVLYSCGD